MINFFKKKYSHTTLYFHNNFQKPVLQTIDNNKCFQIFFLEN